MMGMLGNLFGIAYVAFVSELVTKKLRPGDIYTHAYSGLRNELDDSGHVNPGMVEGRRRGVIFDVGRESLQRVPTLEPLRGTKAHVGALLDRCDTAAELVDGRVSACRTALALLVAQDDFVAQIIPEALDNSPAPLKLRKYRLQQLTTSRDRGVMRGPRPHESSGAGERSPAGSHLPRHRTGLADGSPAGVWRGCW